MFAVLFICVSGGRTFQLLLPLAVQFVMLQLFMFEVLCRYMLAVVLGVCSGMGCYSKWLSYTFSVGNSMETCGYLWESPTLWNGCFIVVSLDPFQHSLCVALVPLRSVKCNSLWFGFAFSKQHLVAICLPSLDRCLSRPLSIFDILWSLSYLPFFTNFWYRLFTKGTLCKWFTPMYGLPPDSVLWNGNVLITMKFNKLNTVTKHGGACLSSQFLGDWYRRFMNLRTVAVTQ